MARPVAADHGDKRAAIRKAAARLFAEQGYDRASMSGVAAALGVSKALFYHYYSSKEALLLDIVESHLSRLAAAVVAADDPSLLPRMRLEQVIAAILAVYRDADCEHRVQIAHLSQLAPAEQEQLKAMERRIVDTVADIVADLHPGLAPRMLKPTTMALFGVINWKYMWFRESGPISESEFAGLVADLFTDGPGGRSAAAP